VRFKTELERLAGHVHIMESPDLAVACVLEIVGTDKAVMAWENLPLPGLEDALRAHKIEIHVPKARGDERAAALETAERNRVGITGVDAAFATTGTLALKTIPGHGRLPSLLPPVHIALLERSRIFARLEDWFAAEGQAAIEASRSIALVSGPSRTGDIEMQTVLGVHGPGELHAIVY